MWQSMPVDGSVRALMKAVAPPPGQGGPGPPRRRGPLQGDQRASSGADQHHAGRQARGDVGVVRLLARGVDDQEQPAVVAPDRPSA